MRIGKRRGAVLLTSTAIAVFVVLLPSTPALAYAKDYWTGKAVSGTVCAPGKVPTPTSTYTKQLTLDGAGNIAHGVYIDLFYSSTCQTAWARMRNGYGPVSLADNDVGCIVEVQRRDGETWRATYIILDVHLTRTTRMVDDNEAHDSRYESRAYGFCYDGHDNYSATTGWY